MVYSEFTFGDCHSEAFDAFYWSKICKYAISRHIYRYLSSHRLSCPPDNVSNNALEGSNVCWVMVFSEFTFGDGHSEAFYAFYWSKICKYAISRHIYRHIDPPDNVSNHASEGSSVCWVVFLANLHLAMVILMHLTPSVGLKSVNIAFLGLFIVIYHHID